MKKIGLFLTIIFGIYFGFIGKFKALELDCTYKYPLNGSSETLYEHEIKFKFDIFDNPKELPSDIPGQGNILSYYDVYLFNGDDKIKLQYPNANNNTIIPKNQKVGDYIILPYFDTTQPFSNNDDMCPALFGSLLEDSLFNLGLKYEGVDNLNEKLSFLSIRFDQSDESYYKLLFLDNTGEIVIGDHDVGKNRKTCSYDILAGDIYGEYTKFDNIWNLDLVSYDDYTAQVCINGECSSIFSTSNNIVEDFRLVEDKENNANKVFYISKNDWNKLKNFLSYNASCSDYIFVYKKGEKFYISLNSEEELKADSNIDRLVKIEMDWTPNSDGTGPSIYIDFTKEVGNCVTYLGSASEDGTLASYLDSVYDIIKIVAILLVIVISMLDLAQNVTKQKEDVIVVVKKIGIRLVLLLVLLLLPTLIDILGNLAGVEEILCGIK